MTAHIDGIGHPYFRGYHVSKKLEQLLIPYVVQLVQQVYGLPVRTYTITTSLRAVDHDYQLVLADGKTVKADLKSAFEARYSVAPATVQDATKRAFTGVDLVILVPERMFYLTNTKFLIMVNQYPPDTPLSLNTIRQYADGELNISTVPEYQSISECANELHRLMRNVRER
jgi:hypothetical protein